METFHITKKKYDWVVVHKNAQYDLTPERREAIEAARRRAKVVIDSGGEAEILIVNTVGLWDKVDVMGGDVD